MNNSEMPRATLKIWLICLLAAFFYAYDFILRVTPSVMIHPLMSWYGVSASQIGLISAFYYYAYTPMQLPSGAIIDKWPLRRVLGGAAFCCGLGAALFAMSHNLYLAFFARALMGFGSSFAFVGALKLATVELPPRYFALFAGITTTLGTLGAMSTDIVLSRSVAHFGWQWTVNSTAVIGFVLAVLLFFCVPKRKKKIRKNIHERLSWKQIFLSMLQLFKKPQFWFNGLVGALLFMPVSVIASLWGVDFLRQRYDLTVTHAASITSLIFFGVAVSSPFCGWLSDFFRTTKKILILSSMLVTFLTWVLIYSDWVSGLGVYLVLFALGFAVGPQILTFANAKDMIAQRSAGMATAANNFVVTLSAAIFQPLIGFMLEQVWNGAKTSQGTPLYQVSDYRFAFMSMLVCMFGAVLLSLFLKEKKHSPP